VRDAETGHVVRWRERIEGHAGSFGRGRDSLAVMDGPWGLPRIVTTRWGPARALNRMVQPPSRRSGRV
jgi:hypothetical protein